jgi:hypothetical protein
MYGMPLNLICWSPNPKCQVIAFGVTKVKWGHKAGPDILIELVAL